MTEHKENQLDSCNNVAKKFSNNMDLGGVVRQSNLMPDLAKEYPNDMQLGDVFRQITDSNSTFGKVAPSPV